MLKILSAPFLLIYWFFKFTFRFLIHFLRGLSHLGSRILLKIFLPIKTLFYLSDDILAIPIVILSKIMKSLGINILVKQKEKRG
jgi:hypothetical protein